MFRWFTRSVPGLRDAQAPTVRFQQQPVRASGPELDLRSRDRRQGLPQGPRCAWALLQRVRMPAAPRGRPLVLHPADIDRRRLRSRPRQRRYVRLPGSPLCSDPQPAGPSRTCRSLVDCRRHRLRRDSIGLRGALLADAGTFDAGPCLSRKLPVLPCFGYAGRLRLGPFGFRRRDAGKGQRPLPRLPRGRRPADGRAWRERHGAGGQVGAGPGAPVAVEGRRWRCVCIRPISRELSGRRAARLRDLPCRA